MVVSAPTVLKGVALLAAQTARSQAYLQALVANRLHPELVIILGEDAPVSRQQQEPELRSWQGISLPDLSEPIWATCERAGIAVSRSPENDVNSDATIFSIRDAAPEMVIYSGVGGQIVSARALETASFLHMHSGWLPEYRGSTTLYYALLNGELPGVTALFLDATIDTGPVVARRRYPRPQQNLDIDRVYDSAIRADLLVRVMREYAATGSIPSMESQDSEQGSTYYVIHPVLKHVAILSLSKEAP